LGGDEQGKKRKNQDSELDGENFLLLSKTNHNFFRLQRNPSSRMIKYEVKHAEQ
jgi:hypothetical protein